MNNLETAENLAGDSLIFNVDTAKAKETLKKSLRVVFWVDVVVFLANLLFLYSWMFEHGFLPDWHIVIQLFFVNTVVLIAQRRAFSPPKGHYAFQITINDSGLVIEDYYTREVVARESLQAVIVPPQTGYLAFKGLGLAIDGRVRMLPEHMIDQARLVEELATRFALPVVDSAEAMRRGWQYSPLKIMVMLVVSSFLGVFLMYEIAELTTGIARIFLFLFVFVIFMFVVHRFISFFTQRAGAVVKRRNPATDLVLIPIIVVLVMTVADAVRMAESKSAIMPPAATSFISPLAVIDPPAIFAPVFDGYQTDEEVLNGFAGALAAWPREERGEYERRLLETAASPEMISPKLAPADKERLTDLTLQPIRQTSRRHRFFHLLMPTIDREDLAVAMVRILCLCAAEIDSAQACLYPGVAGIAPASHRIAAVKMLKFFLNKSTVTRQTALELLEFSQRLEAVLPDAETLLEVENYCWGQRLRMYNQRSHQNRTSFSRSSNYPETDDEKVTQLRKTLFDKPLPILKLYEAGVATFPAVSRQLERCQIESDNLVESWGWRVFDTLLLPYELRYLTGAMYCSYDWADIWTQTVSGRQHLHTLGYIAAISAFQTETGDVPDDLNELCAWLSTASDTVEMPRDYFTGHHLIYDIASGPRLFSAGPDGRPANRDDIVLYP